MYADTAANFTLALVLTLLFAAVTYLLWRRSGRTGTLVTGAGFTLLPFGLWLTRTLALASAIVDDVGSWATNLIFSPRVWIGLIVVAVGIVLIATGARLRRGATGDAPAKAPKKARRGATPAVGAAASTSRTTPTSKGGGAVDDEMADIEAILRNRGIS